jgi:type II secretory pathway pseudopilin PulG
MELVVVLTILAVLTTVAVTTTDSVIDQGRFDATQRTLRNIEDAIVGPAQQTGADGGLAVSGFVADVGRLPLTLDELVANPNNIAGYGPKPSVDDAQVVPSFGWRGPYLRLPAGAVLPVDGWGNAILYTPPAGPNALTLASLGADGLPGGTDYAADTGVVILPVRYDAAVTVTVQLLDQSQPPQPRPLGTNSQIVVRLFGPVPQSMAFDQATAPTGTCTHTFATTVGPRMLRAYEIDNSNPMAPVVRKSRIVPLTVPPGGKQEVLAIIGS